MSALVVSGLEKRFGRTEVLRGVDLHVPKSSFTAVLGPSGCGKTTMLRLIGGFDRPDAGTIVLDGRVLFDRSTFVAPERRQIGYVAQEGALFPHLRVAENITFGLPWRLRRRRQRVEELLELVGLGAEYASRYPHQLSGGQQQRVALARALNPEPAVVLLDEPFSSLDAGLRDSTRRAVADALRAKGTTTILVTHDQAEALSMADQVAVMQDGRFVQVAAPRDLYRTPVDAATAEFVGDAVVLPATIRGGRAETEVGIIDVDDRSYEGSASVLLRPEQLVLQVGAGSEIRAVVTSVRFYGHEAIAELDLSTGRQVVARMPGTRAPDVGDVVAITVDGSAHVLTS